MMRIRPLPLALALSLTCGAAFAASDMNGSDNRPHAGHTSDAPTKGKTAGEGSSVNTPGGTKDNDASDTGTNSDAADGAAGGSNNTGEATGSGAGASGGTAEDQDAR